MEEGYDTTILEGELGGGGFVDPLSLYKVDETESEALWNHLVKKFHYLGFQQMIGCRAKYLVYLGKKLVGAISFCSAAYKLGPRDQFVGWDENTRLEYLPHLLNNNRFLILPWIKVHNLASSILALSLKKVRIDWIEQYGVEPLMVETFVDHEKYRGTCYIASNWTYIGRTKGFGKIGKSFVFHGRMKDIYVLVMNRRFGKIFRPNINRLITVRGELLKMINNVPVKYNYMLNKEVISNFNYENVSEMLAEHLERYIPYLTRIETTQHMVAMIKGLLSDLKRKTCEPIAFAFQGASQMRCMTKFFKRSPFNDHGMLEEYQKELDEVVGSPDGMITCDSIDFLKKGKSSVGVARQYSERFGKCKGKKANCQASVMLGYSSPKGSGLYDYCLYLPPGWFENDHADLRELCRVPVNLEYKTKNQLLLEMIGEAIRSGRFKGKYVGLDSSFGKERALLDLLPKGLIYFADVPRAQRIFLSCSEKVIADNMVGEAISVGTKLFLPRQVKDISDDTSVPWEDVALSFGPNGQSVVKDKIVKVVEERDGQPGHEVWLYIGRLDDGSIKHALCNESMDVNPEKVRVPALARWSIERNFKECKEWLGMDHYEARSWPAWRRHMLFTFITHLFVIKLRRRSSVSEEFDRGLQGGFKA
jgi:SRSO17 transposase